MGPHLGEGLPHGRCGCLRTTTPGPVLPRTTLRTPLLSPTHHPLGVSRLRIRVCRPTPRARTRSGCCPSPSVVACIFGRRRPKDGRLGRRSVPTWPCIRPGCSRAGPPPAGWRRTSLVCAPFATGYWAFGNGGVPHMQGCVAKAHPHRHQQMQTLPTQPAELGRVCVRDPMVQATGAPWCPGWAQCLVAALA